MIFYKFGTFIIKVTALLQSFCEGFVNMLSSFFRIQIKTKFGHLTKIYNS